MAIHSNCSTSSKTTAGSSVTLRTSVSVRESSGTCETLASRPCCPTTPRPRPNATATSWILCAVFSTCFLLIKPRTAQSLGAAHTTQVPRGAAASASISVWSAAVAANTAQFDAMRAYAEEDDMFIGPRCMAKTNPLLSRKRQTPLDSGRGGESFKRRKKAQR